jgi:glycerol-3-phosphate dehydrogenase
VGIKIETEVVVIGGGVTGAGVLRDLALRGIKAILVEQQDLGHGTSTRNHGLLHSGARYAVRDEEAAIESYRENLILKKTIPGSIEQTGGLFVKVPEDNAD